MSAFATELGSVVSVIERALPNGDKGAYALPWYLVLGDPGAGRSTAIRAMNLGWPGGDGTLKLGLAQQLCTYWMANEAIFIEPEAGVVGPRRQPEALRALCDQLRERRPREPIDGILLVLSLATIADLDEGGIERYAQHVRGHFVDVGRALHADVPVYVVLTRYDTLWGFAEVFQWTPERRREEPWGFTLPGDTKPEQTAQRIRAELEGLSARLESFCFAKLSSEDPPEHRARALQHAAEVHELVGKLAAFFDVLAMPSTYDRAPWIRSVAIGSAVPGMGDRPRASMTRFANMGLAPPSGPPASARPGGLPFHSFMSSVVLPERELVPLRVRWRDDLLLIVGFVVGALLWIAAGIAAIAFAIANA